MKAQDILFYKFKKIHVTRFVLPRRGLKSLPDIWLVSVTAFENTE